MRRVSGTLRDLDSYKFTERTTLSSEGWGVYNTELNLYCVSYFYCRVVSSSPRPLARRTHVCVADSETHTVPQTSGVSVCPSFGCFSVSSEPRKTRPFNDEVGPTRNLDDQRLIYVSVKKKKRTSLHHTEFPILLLERIDTTSFGLRTKESVRPS